MHAVTQSTSSHNQSSPRSSKFGDSATCTAATPTADVCGNAEADFGAGCEPVCPDGQADFGSGCVPAVGVAAVQVALSPNFEARGED